MNGEENHGAQQRKVKNCNTTIYGQQYYTSGSTALAGTGDALSIPLLICSILVSMILSMCFGYVAYSQYQVSQWTIGTICLFIIFLICFGSCLKSVMEVKDAKDNLSNITNGKDSRPCYSESENKMIV